VLSDNLPLVAGERTERTRKPGPVLVSRRPGLGLCPRRALFRQAKQTAPVDVRRSRWGTTRSVLVAGACPCHTTSGLTRPTVRAAGADACARSSARTCPELSVRTVLAPLPLRNVARSAAAPSVLKLNGGLLLARLFDQLFPWHIVECLGHHRSFRPSTARRDWVASSRRQTTVRYRASRERTRVRSQSWSQTRRRR
jgi:hypothetical protein